MDWKFAEAAIQKNASNGTYRYENSLDPKLQIYPIRSIRIRSRKWDTFEKPEQLNSHTSVIKVVF